MSTKSSSSTIPLSLLIGLIVFVVGLVIGLVVLGWNIWPVEWSDAAPENLEEDYRLDYLRSAITAYSLDQSEELAQLRYAALGSNAPEDLAYIEANPGSLDPAAIDSFSSAVGVETVPEPASSALPAWSPLVILICVVFFLAVFGIVLFFFLRSRRSVEAPVEPVEEPPAEPTEEFPSQPEEEVPLAEPEEAFPESFPKTADEEVLPEPEEETDLTDSGLGGIPLAAAAVLGESLEEGQEETPPEGSLPFPPLPDELAEEEAPSAESPMTTLNQPLIYVEGIGEVYAQKLREIDIHNGLDLLKSGGTPAGRKKISENTEISEKLILTWVNHVDLFRIRGIGAQYAELLEAAGVDTVPELASRNPENLYAHLVAVNEEKQLVRRLPLPAQVAAWIEQAKTLPRAVNY